MRQRVQQILAVTLVVALSGCATARKSGQLVQRPHDPLVRLAEIEIAPDQLDAYEAAVKEEIATSLRIEPGVLAIYCVAEKDNPTKLRFFEMYAGEAAYRSHIGSPHFRKYVETTKKMIVSRKLIETIPVQLSDKGN